MAKTIKQYLAEHDDDPQAALAAAVADVGKRENQNSSARAFKRTYAPLVEAHKLPVDVDTDSEQEAGTLAARAIEKLSKPAPTPNEGDAPTREELDALQALLEEYAERTGIDLSAVAQSLPDNATDEQLAAAIDAAFQPLKALQTDAYEGRLTLMAQATGKDREALREVLDGKTVELRKVKGEDGTEQDVWGIPQGDAFKPLTELRSIQLLGTPTPEKPTPAPLPTTQRGGTAAPRTLTDEEIRAEIRARQDVDF